jgi:hypothetical protein
MRPRLQVQVCCFIVVDAVAEPGVGMKLFLVLVRQAFLSKTLSTYFSAV